MTDIAVGKHDTGFWDNGNTIIAKDKKVEGTNFNKSKDVAEKSNVSQPTDVKPGSGTEWDTGAELIVGKKTSQGYTFDTYRLAIKDGGMSEKDKRIKDAQHVKFFDDTAKQLGGDEAYIVDENNKITILGDNSDRALSLKVIEHTKARELEAVKVIIPNIKSETNRNTLSSLVNNLENLKNNVEGKEKELKQKISNENSTLAVMEAPFKSKIMGAENELNTNNNILQKSNENLQETLRPGYKLIDNSISNIDKQISEVSQKQKTLESKSMGDKSALFDKASRIYKLEAKNAVLWDKMNNPDGYTNPSSAYDELVRNRKEITQLKKDIFLTSSKIDREKDLAGDLLTDVRGQLNYLNRLKTDISNVKANGKNEGPVTDNPQALIETAKGKISVAKNSLDNKENLRVNLESKLETSRKSIENYEDKLSSVFILKEEINDIKFQLQNMDTYSNWANNWDKDRLKNSMIDKMFKVVQLQNELGMMTRMPSYSDIAREVNSVVSKIPSNPTNVKDDPFSNNTGAKPSYEKALQFAEKIAGGDGWVSKEDLTKAGYSELAENSPLRDSVAGSDNKITTQEFADAIVSGKVKMKGGSSSVTDDPFSNKPSTNKPNTVYDDPFGNKSSFSGLDNIYKDPFSNSNIYSGYNGKTSFSSERDLLDGTINAWNNAIKYSNLMSKFSEYNSARSQLNNIQYDVNMERANYSTKVVHELTNLPNSTPQNIDKAKKDRENSANKVNESQNKLNAANNEFKTDPNLTKQRGKINELNNELNNTSGTFEKLSEEAKKKLVL